MANVVSSQKYNKQGYSIFDKSLINTKNNIGPNTELFGTPYCIGKVENINELK